MAPEKPLCLFIAPLKGDDSVTRERSEDVYASLVVPAAQQAGFRSEFILDDAPGTIMNHIVRSIKTARVVVADITSNNFSVGYELGFAHMLRKPTIPIIRNGSAKPFDVQTMRAVEYDYANRGTLRGVIPQLVEQLMRVKKSAPIMFDNPLQNALRAVEPPRPTSPPPVTPTAPPPIRLVPPVPTETAPRSVFNSLPGVPTEPEPRARFLAGLFKPPDKS